jgi:hypothetical protein
MSNTANSIDSFQSQRHTRFPVLSKFTIEQRLGGQSAPSLFLSLELASDVETNQHLVVSFEGVRDLKIDWPQWSVIRLDAIVITDVSDRGLEGIRYRVAEGEEMFTFWCEGFDAAISRG